MARRGVVAAALGVGCVLGACTTGTPAASPTTVAGSVAAQTSSAAAQTSSAATTAAPTSATTTPAEPAPAPDPASIQALIDADFDGHGLRLGREGGSTSAYRQYFVTYEGDGLTISGRINIPRGRGPFPAVVLAHGYVDPDEYTNGETMLRERNHLARQGYVTLHIDYRNHAESDRDPRNDAHLRSGYTRDAINAGLALQRASFVDRDRLAIIGRSMGGGVVYNAIVARPGLFRAAVAYSPVSSDSVDNFNRWVRRDSSRAGAARQAIDRLGTPEAAPRAWAATSPRTYFDRITEPVMIHHGTADEDCPIAWSVETVDALEAAGKDVTYHVYRGQGHTFTSQWLLSIRRTETFLARHLR